MNPEHRDHFSKRKRCFSLVNMNRYFKLTKNSRSTLKLNSSHILRRLVESKVTRFDEKQQQVFGLLQNIETHGRHPL